MSPNPLPLRVDRNALYHEQQRSLYRALAAAAIGRSRNSSAETVRKSYWPGDDGAQFLTRAPVNPLDRNNYPQITSIRILPLIARKAAATRLFDDCMRLDFAGVYDVGVANAVTEPSDNLWVAEGAPIPVTQELLTIEKIGPVKKMAFICGVTDEVAEQSPENASNLIGRLMSQAASKGLDRKVFSDDAETSAAPAGLLHGVTPLAAGASMAADLSSLVGAISDADVLGDVVLVTHPTRALSMALLSIGALPNVVLTSGQIPADRIIAIGLDGVASGYDGVPTIEASKAATVHFADPAVPINLGVPATPTTNALQNGLTLLKLRMQCAWGVVQPGAVQYIDNITAW